MNIAGKHRNTNIILMDVPHRHDLEMKSCVNKEIKAFNRKLRNLSERIVNLPVSDVSTNTEIYTRHGLHLNRRGKGQTAEKTVTETRTLFKLNKEVPIVLQWKQEETRTKTIVGVEEVNYVSDAEVDNLEPLGKANSTPPSKSDEKLNSIVPNSKLESKNITEPAAREVITVLDSNQNNPEELLLENTNTTSKTLDHQKDPVIIKISNRKKQFPLTRNEDFLLE